MNRGSNDRLRGSLSRAASEMSPPPRLLLISSVPPVEAGGGESVLYHHLRGLTRFDRLVITDRSLETPGFVQVQPAPWLRRLQHTRFAPYAHAWAQFHPGRALACATWRSCQTYRPDVILTVAHGILWPVARRMAVRLGAPLVTMFMDWWPDLAPVPGWFRHSIERAFRAHYRGSRIALAISPGMIAELGSHPDVRLQYPVPGPAPSSPSRQPSPAHRFRLAYCGNMRDIYAPMTQALFAALENHPLIEARFIGADPEWPSPVKQRAIADGAYRGFLGDEAMQQELQEADALLAVMTWAPEAARRMRTSFPSKILTYCQYGKPVVVWAPASSSAAAWARQTGAALLIDQPGVGELAQALGQLAADRVLCQSLGARAAECAGTMFDPGRLQKEFEAALIEAMGEHASFG